MKDMYKDGTYLEHNPSWHQKDSPWKARQIRQILERNALAPKRICEIGCGAGEILSQLSEQSNGGEQYFGYEISPQAFGLCKTKSKPNLTFILQDILATGDKHFDVVMAIDVVEHVEDCFGFLRKVKAIGDYKIFHIPLDISVQSVLRMTPILSGRKNSGHLHYFTRETALETLRDTGYQVIDYCYTAGSLEVPHRGWKTNMMKMPRKIMFAANKDLAVRVLGGYSLLVLAK